MAQTTLPAPIKVPASGLFEGVDGPWSTFNLTIGSNDQPVRLLPSTKITETLVIDSTACDSSSPANCTSLRGGTFDISQSNTWQGNASLIVNNEPALDNDQFNAEFGLDTISVPGPNSEPISLDGQIIASANTTAKLLEIGLLALSTQATAANSLSIPNVTSPVPSYLTALRAANKIPGSGFGYTAGASYQNTTGNLILGGYDTSRYTPNNITFTIGPGPGELQVGIQQIDYNDNSGAKQPLLTSSGFSADVDSTIPDLWLPIDVCNNIAKAFNLTWHANNLRYTIDDDTRATLKTKNASMTFTIGNSATSGPTMDIVLPYEAFDLLLEPPMISSTTRYFPIRQASSGPSQNTLGRTFFQEAFLLANYEQSDFKIYQAIFPPGQEHILPITAGGSTGSSGSQPSGSQPSSTSTAAATPSSTSLSVTHTSSGGGISGGAIAGIIVGVLVIAACIAAWFLWRRRRRNRGEDEKKEISEMGVNEHKGYYGGPVGDESEPQYAPGHFQKPSLTASEVEAAPVGRHSRNDTEIYHVAPAELDEGAPRGEMESPLSASPERSPRLGNKPTYIELPSPAYSRQSSGLPSPPAEDTQSISQALSQQHFHLTRQSPMTSPADEVSSQISASAFQSPQLDPAPARFGHPSPEGQLPPFNLNHSPAQSPVDLSQPRSSPGPES